VPRTGLNARLNPGLQAAPPNAGQIKRDHAAQLLGAWKEQELSTAGRQYECRGLTPEQLEEIYQETTLGLLPREDPWENEEHLRNALRAGIRRRAPHLHRDENRHRTILAAHAPTIHAHAQEQALKNGPEHQTLAREDQQLIIEFLAGLTQIEQEVFALWAEGLRCRRIAHELEISNNEALNASRAIEQKRERYALLYTTGRLCGYRRATINGLKEGKQTSEQLAQGAIAHIQSCPRCRVEHQTTAKRLRQAFTQQAVALLPLPTLTHTSWLSRALAHTKRLQRHPGKPPLHASQAHARLAMILANTGTPTRVAGPLAAAALLTAGAIGANHALTHTSTPHHHHPIIAPATATPLPTDPIPPRQTAAATHRRYQPGHAEKPLLPFGPGHVVAIHPHPATERPQEQHTPGGFAYLGVPPPTPRTASPEQQTHIPGGGGEFSP
jgi:DNA-directed RNA polymerase specialized sigma24 family protein